MSNTCHFFNADYSYINLVWCSGSWFTLFFYSYLMLTFSYIRFLNSLKEFIWKMPHTMFISVLTNVGQLHYLFMIRKRTIITVQPYIICSVGLGHHHLYFRMSDQKKRFIHASHVQNCHTRYVIIIQLADHCRWS
jgi:hypothetical protein